MALRDPVNLGVLGASLVGAVVLASWPIAAIGTLAYAALVANDLTKRPTRFDPMRLRDETVQRAGVRIRAAREAVDQVVRGLPPRIRHNIPRTLAALDELEAHAGVIATRADELSQFLAGLDRDDDATALTSRSLQVRDPAARADYQEAARTAYDRARTIDALDLARERSLAHLAKIAAAIKAVPSQLVRLRALDDEASDSLTSGVGDELDQMNIDLRAFEQTLESLVEVKQ